MNTVDNALDTHTNTGLLQGRIIGANPNIP